MSRSLVILAKWPETGRSKTRLAEELGGERAVALAHAFLKDTVFRLRSLSLRKVLAYDPPEAHSQFAALAQDGYVLCSQVQGHLGARLQALLLAEWQAGFSEVIFLGTDSPTLPLAWISQAFDMLGRTDVVIGPAVDGGYYLLGCRRSARWLALVERLGAYPEPSSAEPSARTGEANHTAPLLPIFSEIAWGTPQVLDQTVAQVESFGLRLALLPVWYDVDTASDWEFLQAHVRALRYAGMDPAIPHTETFLAEQLDEH